MKTPAKPTANPKLTPAQLEAALNSEQAIRSMVPEMRRKALAELIRAKQRLVGSACSQAWVDHCWETGAAFPPPADNTPMVQCTCERCQRQGRSWPSSYDTLHRHSTAEAQPNQLHPSTHSADSPLAAAKGSEEFIAYDCYLESLDPWSAAQLPSSPSGLALRAVREGRIKLRRQRTRLGRSRAFLV